MAAFHRFEDIHAWRKARVLRREVKLVSLRIADAKDWGFQRQLNDAALSIMNNISEGFGRFSDRDFARFLAYSRSSAFEVQSMLYAAEDDGYANPQERERLHGLADEVIRMVGALIVTLIGRDVPPDESRSPA